MQQAAISGCNRLQFQVATACNFRLQFKLATACNFRLQQLATDCNMLQFQVATDCNTLQFQVATDYNRLQFQINFKLQFQVAVQVSVLGCNFRLQFQISDFNFSFSNQLSFLLFIQQYENVNNRVHFNFVHSGSHDSLNLF